MVLKTHCELPEHGIFISPQGYVTSCCVSMQDPFGNVNIDNPTNIWSNTTAINFRNKFAAGDLPTSCDLCVKNNEAIRPNKSKKIKELKKPGDKIVHADITLGNVCQLTCTMCGPTWSHTWAKLKNEQNKIWHMSKEKMYELLETIKGVKDIEIKGGEPFFMPYFSEFINELHKQNPDVRINILTNGLHINPSHIEQLKKLKHVHIGFSAEATGDLYQYIRGGRYTFDNVLDNIKILKEELGFNSIHLSSVLSFYNITKWVEQHEEIQYKLKNDLNLTVNYSCNLVEYPLDQNVFLAKRSIREQWLKDLHNSKINLDFKDYMHLIDDRIVDISRDAIMASIKYYNGMRGIELDNIVPNLLDTLDERYV